MNQQEWLLELERYLSVLPTSEQKRVSDYYREMIADRLEAGKSEEEVIAEFGNPYDAAQEVIEGYKAENPDFVPPNYDSESGFARQEGPKPQPEIRNLGTKEDRKAIWILLCVFFCIPIVALYIAMISVSIVLIASLIALYASGIWLMCIAFVYFDGFLLLFGGGLVVLGIGVLLSPFFGLAIRWMFKGMKMFLGWIKKVVMGESI